MNELLEQLNTFRIRNDSKEYYLRLRVYSKISRNVDALYNLKVEKDEEDVIIINKDEIAERIEGKYKAMLQDKG